jgi:hypothetical protein
MVYGLVIVSIPGNCVSWYAKGVHFMWLSGLEMGQTITIRILEIACGTNSKH